MSYALLHERFKRIGDLDHALAMLSWDEATMMPSGGGEARGEALATLRGMAHEMASAPEVGDTLRSAAGESLDAWQAANVSRIERIFRRASALPGDLVVAHSKAATVCEQTWRTARADNDWPAVAEKLREVVRLTCEQGDALGEALGLSAYDALLDDYEPGLKRADIDPMFAELRTALPALIDRAIDRQPPLLAPQGPFSIDRQEALGRALMTALGFDFERGRLDTSHHPFCGGEPDDTRITTRYNEADFLESMYAVLHETGHAMYQQGLPAKWRGQPVGAAGGMALHESQSLTMEMQVCRGPAFLEFAAPIVQRALLGRDSVEPEWQADNLASLAARVERGAIRVEADELTYPLHVVLRYELETALVAGDLAVADLPDAWNAKMDAYLGLDMRGDFANGVMQDVHWFAGLIGYFPTYTVGAVIAAQLYRAARDAIVGLDDCVRRGELDVLLRWLREHVHSKGNLLPTMALVKEATGAPLGTEAFLAHVRERYS